MKQNIYLSTLMALLFAAAPAMGVSINPESTNTTANEQVNLNASVGGNDNGCTYSWDQTEGTDVLGQPDGKHWKFTTPDVNANETLKFQVTVTGCGDKNGTATATVNVATSNAVPTANITVLPDDVYEGTNVIMYANGYDADGDTLTYSWEQTDGPAMTLSSTTSDSVTFTAPNDPNSADGFSLEFKVKVSDGKSTGISTKTVTVKWLNDPPTAALICTPATVDEGKLVTLDGSGSTDSDDGIASYIWSQTLGYGGDSIALPDNTVTSKFDITVPSLTSEHKRMTFELKITDNGELSDSITCDILVNDITPPTFSDVPTDITAEADSNSGAVVNFAPTATDAVDGVCEVTCDPASNSNFLLDTTTKVTCTASDTSNNKAEAFFNVTVVDTTPPALTLPNNIGPIEGDTLGGATITYSASATDLVDGNVNVTCSPASGTVFPVGSTTVTCQATDAHHNTAIGSFDVTVKDTTPPEITVVSNIADGSSFYFGAVPPAPTCTASDIVSGPVSCTVAGYATSVGPHTLTATAMDKSDNTAYKTMTYTVLAWTLKGFYSPIDMNGVTNTVKGGSTVPMKFEVFVGSTELTTTSSISSIQTKIVNCSSLSDSEDPVDALATGGTVLRYDTTAGQFIYNWQTPKSAGTCYVATVTTNDGSTISANFKLK